jgi:hypothetical protein
VSVESKANPGTAWEIVLWMMNVDDLSRSTATLIQSTEVSQNTQLLEGGSELSLL